MDEILLRGGAVAVPFAGVVYVAMLIARFQKDFVSKYADELSLLRGRVAQLELRLRAANLGKLQLFLIAQEHGAKLDVHEWLQDGEDDD